MARIVSIDGTKAAESAGGFALLPEGDWIAEIISTKDGVYKSEKNSGVPKLELGFKIIEGPDEFVGKKFKDFNIPMQGEWKNGTNAFMFYQFFEAVGVKFPKKGETADVELPDNEELWGVEIGVTSKIKPDDKGIDRNNWTYFHPSKGIKNPPKIGEAGSADTEDEFDLDAAA